MFVNALGKKDSVGISDRTIIEAVYQERSKVGKYFSKSTPKIQTALLSRFREELQLALSRLS